MNDPKSGWKMMFVVLVVLCAAACGTSESSPADEQTSTTEVREELGVYFEEAGVEGTFVMLDPQEGRTVVYNPERAGEPFIPASTFKIPHALIALETGVVSGPDHEIEWDEALHPRQNWWPEVWAQDHTLSSAISNSAIWYFQEVAKEVGEEHEREYLDRFDYGNGDVSGGIEQFWLTGGLRTTAMQQIEFLERFYEGKLGVDESSTQTVKEAIVLEDTPEYRLSGKSGWARLGDESTPQLGWLVGYVEKGDEVYYYALNLDIEEPEDADARLEVTKSALADLGVIPAT